MDVLELNGNKYVKASSIARELGYTADYVGQLCRNRKVDAQLVGRSWYVNDDSIRSHKNSRYRSTKAKTTEELQRTITTREAGSEKQTQQAYKIPVRVQSPHFYNKIVKKNTQYTEDQSDLIPVLTEKASDGSYTEIEVRHADAKQIPVKKTQKPYSLSPTKRPTIRFKGKVSIVEPIDTVKEIDSEEKPQPKNEHKVADDKPENETSIRKAKMEIEGVNQDPQKIVLRRSGVVSMTRIESREEGDFGELTIVSQTATNTRSARATFAYISTALAVAAILGVGAIFIENSVVVISESDTQSSTYTFNLSSVLESFKP